MVIDGISVGLDQPSNSSSKSLLTLDRCYQRLFIFKDVQSTNPRRCDRGARRSYCGKSRHVAHPEYWCLVDHPPSSFPRTNNHRGPATGVEHARFTTVGTGAHGGRSYRDCGVLPKRSGHTNSGVGWRRRGGRDFNNTALNNTALNNAANTTNHSSRCFDNRPRERDEQRRRSRTASRRIWLGRPHRSPRRKLVDHRPFHGQCPVRAHPHRSRNCRVLATTH
ncbi:MAG: hypothetical protein ACI8TP_000749 [Acidimicrobiales bacterium]|jgi:hypothetical protein